MADCTLAFFATLALCQDKDSEYANRFDGQRNVEFSSRTTATYRWFNFQETMTAPQAAQAAVMDCGGTDDICARSYNVARGPCLTVKY